MNAHPPLTFYWHDYETFGLSPAKDRPAQFAGIRTDLDLNMIGEPLKSYCQPMPDYLPSPMSCLITGITPQACVKNGVPEPQFARHIHRELARPNTIGVGYNSLRFDDEVTRFMFWRNFIPPYQREFSNGCSRWDIIDMVRCVYALRPEGVVFPQDETGKVSLRLEKLSVANGLAHDAAHDALSDVQATIALAKLIKKAQPRLFEFCLNLRDKNVVQTTIGWPYTRTVAPKPLIHVSGMFGAERRFLAIVYPLAIHPVNKNELIVWDLAHDITPLSQLSVDEIRERMFTSVDELASLGLSRLPIKTIHINKSPVVIAQLKTLNDTQAQACGVDWDVIEAHEANAQAQFDALQKIDWQAVFAREYDDAQRCAEEALYGGAFISDADYRQANLAMDANGAPTGVTPKFKDARLTELWWRYRARFYPETLSANEQAQWQEWRAEQLLGINGEGGMDAWTDELNQLASEYAEHPEQLDILRAVYAHAQSLVEDLEQ
jgi:exodeoxyribonuclease-1